VFSFALSACASTAVNCYKVAGASLHVNGKLLPPAVERGGSIVPAVLEFLRSGFSGSSAKDFNFPSGCDGSFLDISPKVNAPYGVAVKVLERCTGPPAAWDGCHGAF
jgi:hypothetical protein